MKKRPADKIKNSRIKSSRTKKVFIPCSENNFRPSFFETKFSVLLGLVILGLFIFSVNIPKIISKLADYSQSAAVLPGVLIDLTNEERSKAELNTLKVNELLNKAALLKAQDMASKGYFAHVSPEGKKPWNWLQDVDYKYQYAGENLAVNFSESVDVTVAWMNSPTHKANIIKPVYKEIGMAVATGTLDGVESVFVAQVFASPYQAGGPAFALESMSPITNSIKSFFNYMFYHNHEIGNIILISFLVLVVVALILVVFIKIKIQHVKLITNALLLIALIIILLLVNQFIKNQKASRIQFSSFEYNIDQNGQINSDY